MKSKRLAAVFLGFALAVTSIAVPVCATDNATTESSEPKKDENKKSFGTVKSIDTEKNQVTISGMNMGFGGNRQQKPDGDNAPSEKPEGGDFDPSQMPQGGDFDPSQMPEGGDFDPSQMPQGGDFSPSEKPSGEDGKPSQMPGGGEDKVYNVTKDTVVTDKEGKAIELADLEENTFVEYTVDGDDLLTITVTDRESMSGKGGPDAISSATPEETEKSE